MKIQIVSLLAAVGVMAGCASYRNDQVVLRSDGDTTPDFGTQLQDLPAPVQNTIRAQAPGALIDDIDREVRTGRPVYEVTFAEPGRNPKLHIAEDGSIVKSDTFINEAAGASAPTMGTEFDELPAAVQQAIQRYAPNARIDDIDKERRTGRVVYEITFAEPGKNPKLHIAEDGALLEAVR